MSGIPHGVPRKRSKTRSAHTPEEHARAIAKAQAAQQAAAQAGATMMATQVQAAPMGIAPGTANLIEVNYEVGFTGFHHKYAEVVLVKQTNLKPGDPGYVGGVPEKLRFTSSDYNAVMPFQPGAVIRLSLEVLTPALAPAAPAPAMAQPWKALAAPGPSLQDLNEMVAADPTLPEDRKREMLAMSGSIAQSLGMHPSQVEFAPASADEDDE